MSFLTPVPGDDAVPQIETTTPLLGGPGGPLNGQAQALLNRIERIKESQADLTGADGAGVVQHHGEPVSDLLDSLPLHMSLDRGTLDAVPGWDAVPRIGSTNEDLSGPDGALNAQAQALLNRIEELGGSLQLSDYAALRSYNGLRKAVQITGLLVTISASVFAGTFVRDDVDASSADNGGTIIVSSNGVRWKRIYFGPINVGWFGAKGDGVADDTAPIQQAINWAKASGGGCVEFNSGRTFKTSARINVLGNFGFNGIELRGNGATIKATADDIALLLSPAGASSNDAANEYRQRSNVHGFNIVGPGKSKIYSVGVQVQQGANVHVHDCRISGFYRGLHGYGALICSFSRILMENCEFGTDLLPTTPSGATYDPQFSPNDLHFHTCQWISNTKAIRALSFPAGAITFYGCEIEGNNIGGNATDGVRVVEFFNAGKVTFIGCHMEENPGEYNLYFHGNNLSCQLNIIGGEVIPGDVCGTCIHLANDSGVDAAANATIIGTRITNNGPRQLYITEGFKVTVIGEIFGGIQGYTDRLTIIKNGRAGFGGLESAFAKVKAKGDPVNNIGYDCDGIFRFVDGPGNRLGYMGNNGSTTYMLSDGTPLTIGTNAGTRVVIGRVPNAVEPNADGTLSLGTSANRWANVYASNLSLKPPASVTPSDNGELTFELTSNTQLKIKVKGTDGVVRSASLTLA